jgi:hypothetical protein
MKNYIFSATLIIFVGFIGLAQNSTELVNDQNPNYQTSLNKYLAAGELSNQTLTQGTTAQDTYTAIDPMEERRKRQELRRFFRSQRPLWRHQERLERAKNPSFFNGRRNPNFNFRNGFNNRNRFNSRNGFNSRNNGWFNNRSFFNFDF